MATQSISLWNGLKYITPDKPKYIRGSELKKKDQVWTRHTEYEQWGWNDDPKRGVVWWEDPEPGQLEWYYEEIERILNGEWVKINGEDVFLNNFAYFYFNWFVTKEGERPKYKDICVHFMYFLEMVFADPKCRGGNCMKGRRKHVSTMCMSVMLQFGIIKTSIEQGITSKEAIDAEKIFKLMLVNGYAKLPNFLKPRIAGTDLPVKTMHITKQAGRITKDSTGGADREGLNNKIEWRAPSLNVFDGDGLWFLLLDEAGKWPDIPIDDYLEIALNIIVTGAWIGRIMIITTVNKGDKGGSRYKVTWQDADQSKRDELGQTKNKLYQYFIPGYMGGREGGWIDKYGNSVWDTPTPEQTEWLSKDGFTLDPNIGCKAYCELQRKLKANDPEKLAEEIRMFPFNPEEVFKDANNLCYFNVHELNEQKDRVQAKLEYASLYRKGWFKADQNGDAHFQDAPLGTPDKNEEFMWYILDMPEQKDANKYTWQGGQMTPTNTDYGVMGADLVMNSEKTAEKGSDAAMCIFKRYNALDPENSGMPVALGIGRPSSIPFMHEQLFLALRYYGIKALIERSPIAWYDYAKEKKLLGYCMKTNLKISGEDRYGVAVQDAEAREQHLTEQIEYASTSINKIWFLRILEDMFGFNVKERTIYDACMAFGYALMGLKDKQRMVVRPEEEAQIIRLHNLRSKYGS
jgi:hypothetical protein